VRVFRPRGVSWRTIVNLSIHVRAAVIFGVTACKEAIDDMHRYRADAAANGRKYFVLREGRRMQVASSEIRVGEIVYLQVRLVGASSSCQCM
jgi:magnesium-transporting ATPase (P-type)